MLSAVEQSDSLPQDHHLAERVDVFRMYVKIAEWLIATSRRTGDAVANLLVGRL